MKAARRAQLLHETEAAERRTIALIAHLDSIERALGLIAVRSSAERELAGDERVPTVCVHFATESFVLKLAGRSYGPLPCSVLSEDAGVGSFFVRDGVPYWHERMAPEGSA